MSKQAAVRLPDETYARLHALAARTGRTPTFYIREAVEAHLEDLEDIYLAEEALIKHRASGQAILSLNDLDRDLGLDS